jgi:uncharacterized membrane protein HdeD (DUF308 family)
MLTLINLLRRVVGIIFILGGLVMFIDALSNRNANDFWVMVSMAGAPAIIGFFLVTSRPYDPNEDNSLMLTILRGFRILGWAFFIIGSIAFVDSLMAFRDPSAVIVVNHRETSDSHTKLVVMLATALFPLIGAVLAFTPSRLAEKFLALIKSQIESQEKDRM